MAAERHDQIGGTPARVLPSLRHGKSEGLHAATGDSKIGDEDDRLYQPVTHAEILTRDEGEGEQPWRVTRCRAAMSVQLPQYVGQPFASKVVPRTTTSADWALPPRRSIRIRPPEICRERRRS